MTCSPKILIVDDHPVNIAVIRKKLENAGMSVMSASGGMECLEITRREPPDLILLDVSMPEVDGIETCKRLKTDEATRSIPVVFLTAMDTRKDMLEGLDAGGIDYLTKPVDLDEALARVKTQLRYQQMFKENLELTERLNEARRVAGLGALSQGISHNLNNLLGVIYGFLGLAKMNMHKPVELRKNLDQIEKGVARMTSIIRQVTAVSTRIQISVAHFEPSRLVDNAVQRLRLDHGLSAPVDIVDQTAGAKALANIEVFEDALSKVLLNAWESYGANPPDGPFAEVRILEKELYGSRVVEFQVLDRGKGLEAKIRDSVFEPFVSGKSTVGVGMGLTIARHGIRNLNGEIELSDREGGGTIATIHLPTAASPKASAA